MKNTAITNGQVKNYLNEEFSFSEPQQLFDLKSPNPQHYFNCVNQTFKHFAGHYIDDTNQLVCEDPDDPVFQYYVAGYPGYEPLNSIDDLVWDLNQALALRDQNLETYKRRIGLLKDKEQGEEIER